MHSSNSTGTKLGLTILLIMLIAGCAANKNGTIQNVTNGSIFNNSETGTYTPAQLKYLILDHYNESQLFFCDPDYYPIGSPAREMQRAQEYFPIIQNDSELFTAILARTGLKSPFSNETKLIIYREYKKLNAITLSVARTPNVYIFTLQLKGDGEGKKIYGAINTKGVILEERSGSAFLTCPICLAGNTSVDTPQGPVNVKDLKVGMLVWTLGYNGSRIAVPITKTTETPVPPTHKVIHLVLSDDREVYASPNHPTADNRKIGELNNGDKVDGAAVIAVDLVEYDEPFTYDLLPDSDTGTYWANGILLKSTLISNN